MIVGVGGGGGVDLPRRGCVRWCPLSGDKRAVADSSDQQISNACFQQLRSLPTIMLQFYLVGIKL